MDSSEMYPEVAEIIKKALDDALTSDDVIVKVYEHVIADLGTVINDLISDKLGLEEQKYCDSNKIEQLKEDVADLRAQLGKHHTFYCSLVSQLQWAYKEKFPELEPYEKIEGIKRIREWLKVDLKMAKDLYESFTE